MTIRVEGMDKLLAKLTRLEQLTRVKAELRAVAVHIKGKISQYPAQPHRKQGFVSDRQRRGFFYHLRHGNIEVPYRRGISPGSEALRTKWTIEGRDDGMTQVVGNNASYAPLVQGPGTQTRYHAATGWNTTEKIAQQERAYVSAYLTQAVQREIDNG